MRDYNQAIGKIAGCCSVLGASYRGYPTQNGNHQIGVNYGGYFTIVARPSESVFRALNFHELTNIEDFPITESVPYVNVEDELADIINTLPANNIRLDSLTEVQDDEGIEYFDGYQASVSLFVYDDSFGAKQFDEKLAELNHTCREAFNTTLSRFDIETDEIEEAAGSKRGDTGDDIKGIE